MILIRTVQTVFMLFVLAIPLCVQAQTVATLGNYTISSKEFIWVYKKNKQKKAILGYVQLAQFLEQYIDFKLKVLEAKALALDKDTAYLAEVENFERILRAKYKNKSGDLEYTVNEFKEGVLMFNVSEKKIWGTEQSGKRLSVEDLEILEKNWIAELRKRYSVNINEQELIKLSKY